MTYLNIRGLIFCLVRGKTAVNKQTNLRYLCKVSMKCGKHNVKITIKIAK